ncbi:NAD(P)-binding protein, partial [Streptomyces sp. e14]|uniref:NAD(P)-binding protein n=1 Tax=Streptomyces sp. e14 TaxID=645465 RepID=UPI003FCCE1BC
MALTRRHPRCHAGRRQRSPATAGVRSSAVLRVAVVGSGPSGCYTAQGLVQQDSSVRVDVLDRLPCPYGLVRYGVAPDHEKIKSLQGSLRAVLEHERVRFLGGVRIGGPDGLPVGRLRQLYHAGVYCVGASTDRRL